MEALTFLSSLSISIIYWINLACPKKIFSSIGLYGTYFINLCLFVSLTLRWVNFGYFPLSNLYESLVFLAWSINFLTLVINNTCQLELIATISTPIVHFIIGFCLSLPENMKIPMPLVPVLKSNWLMMHVSTMLVSYASLMIGCMLSALYLILIKLEFEERKYYHSRFYLQIITSIDNLSYKIIGFGFVFLTTGIISGAVWANEAWGAYWSWDPKETWALITWLLFASYFHSRLSKHSTNKQSAYLASFGFIAIWICYLGVNFLGQGLHTYGQVFN